MATHLHHTNPERDRARDLPPATPRITLNSDEGGTVAFGFATLPIEVIANASGPGRLVMDALPPPGSDGVLPAWDGRIQIVRDPKALAASINNQPLPVRIDSDHQSEPKSPTYQKSTAAVGWLRDFFVNERDGISAVVEEGGRVRGLLRERVYRFLSPAVYLDGRRNVTGLSSVALVNVPNFLDLRAPLTNAPQARPSFSVPRGEGGLGYVIGSAEGQALHAEVSAHATARGISYRDAVLELGARR